MYLNWLVFSLYCLSASTENAKYVLLNLYKIAWDPSFHQYQCIRQKLEG